MDENNKVVEDASSPVQMKDGLDILGDLRLDGVVLKLAPDIFRKIFRLVAVHLLLTDLLAAHVDVRLGAGEKN